MHRQINSSGQLAAFITKSASQQTYYTIHYLADRDRVEDAYRAYGYFRWVDDVVDDETNAIAERIAFINRQKSLLDSCYCGEAPNDLCTEEWMLVDLIGHDIEENSGLQIYLRNMMEVMSFDARRRGRSISQVELSEYSHRLAKAVTEALHYFIGHRDPSPPHETRYMAVTAAHITHMLRDTHEDIENGFFNIPCEYLQLHGISSRDIKSSAYHKWVCGRVQLAYSYFTLAYEYTARVRNWRCRLAGCAYTARFEWMLRAIERDNYSLRCEYPERKSLIAGLWMAWRTFITMFMLPVLKRKTHRLAPRLVGIDKR